MLAVTAAARQGYTMSFGVGGLDLNESLLVAGLHVEGSPWKQTIDKALDQGVTCLPKAASNRRVLREIGKRLRSLTAEERRLLLDTADRCDQQGLLWVATCRAYRFVREFAVEVVEERWRSRQYDLPLESFDLFLDAKAEWDAGLARLARSTRERLRSALFRLMREAGLLCDHQRIQAALLSPGLKARIASHNPHELALFPGILITTALVPDVLVEGGPR